MSKTLSHKGCAAQIGFDAEDHIFFGRIAGIADNETFHAVMVEDLVSASQDAVDEYIAMSAKLGRKAQKPYSGKLMLRVPPELHACTAMLAEAFGKKHQHMGHGAFIAGFMTDEACAPNSRRGKLQKHIFQIGFFG